MSETKNLLKIQEFIDDHKDDLTEGDYLLMVNTLMKAWQNTSHQQTNRERIENELIQTIYDINFNYQCEKRLHTETKTLYKIQCGKNQEQQKEIKKLVESNSVYITIYFVLIITVSYIIL